MELLVGLFGYLSVMLQGITGAAQATAIGSAMFLVFLVQPRGWLLGAADARIGGSTVLIGAWAAAILAVGEAAGLALQAAVLTATLDMPVEQALRAQFALASLGRIGGALLLASVLSGFGRRAPAWVLLPISAALLAAATFSTHAAARLEFAPELLAAAAVHQFGAALWIGGIPAFVAALARTDGPGPWHVVGARFSALSMAGVACLLGSAAVMAVAYVGEPSALYGTAYGVMVSAKIAMAAALLLMGLGNFRLIRRMPREHPQRITRLRRFAEVEIIVGFVVFFAAASLTSVPPSVDLQDDRVTFAELIERNTPRVPRLSSPDADTLGLPVLQAKLDREAAASASRPQPAYVPGSGKISPRNANDIAWSEYNHQWAGFFVLAIGLFALLHRAGLRVARHWPLLFLGLAGFLFIRSDPDAWPLGHISLLDSIRDVDVLQHRVVVLLLIAFGIFEWRVRVTEDRPGGTRGWQPLVFPLGCVFGGLILLTHTHVLANVKEELLVEITHTPLALAGIAAGAARWLELRLDPPGNRRAGWVWPLCFLFVGLLLVFYREA